MAVLVAVAIALVLAYGAYLAPQWDPSRDDQAQYLALARGLVDRGQYTRATIGEPFVPEPLRFPGYPLFLAPLCVAGCSPWLITIAQSLLAGALVVLVARYARPLVGRRGALIAAALVALYPQVAFFGAHALSDLLAAVLATATIVAASAVASSPRRVLPGLAIGALAGATTLVRPFLVFVLPLALMALAFHRARRAAFTACVFALLGFAIVVAPYVAYVEASFARPLAGSTGAQLWLGYFQGRAESDLDAFEHEQADAGRAALARFDATTDRVAQAYAFVALDDELRTRALRLIGHDPAGFLARGALRSVQLWDGDVPVRPEDANGLTSAVWVLVNVVLLVLGVAGGIRLTRRNGLAAAMPLLVIVVTWVLSYPLWAEGRFSLPARPFIAMGVAAFVEDALRSAHG